MLQHLAIRHKLLLLLLPPVFAALALTGYLFAGRYQMLQEYEVAHEMTVISGEASQLVHALQAERGLSNGFLSGSGAPPAALLEARGASDQALTRFVSAAEALNDTELAPQLTPLISSLQGLAQARAAINARSVPAPQAFAAYSQHIEQLIALVSGVVEVSRDNELAHSGMALLSLLNEKESAGRERGYVNGLLAAGSMSPAEQDKMVALGASQQSYAHSLKLLANPAQRTRLEALENSAASREVSALRQRILAVPPAEVLGVEPSVWFAAATAKIGLLKAEQDQILSGLDAHILQQLAQSQRMLWMSGIASVLLTALLSLLAWRVYASIHRPLTQLEQLMSLMSRDLDLSHRANLKGNDGIARMAQAFDSLVASFAQTLQTVKGNTHTLLDAAQGLSDVSGRAAHAADLQSASSAQIAAAIEQMSVGITSVSENTEFNLQAVREMTASIEDGRSRMAQTAQAIRGTASSLEEGGRMVDELSARSQQITGIITAIRDIADQTNLLALNAAIEAARAGEAGRGFAVVADEVRKLAERTGLETVNIADLVSAIGRGTEAASLQLKSAQHTMCEGLALIDVSVEDLAGIREKAAASADKSAETALAIREQSSASTDVAVNISRIAELAEENLTQVAESAQLASRLSQAADELATQVDRFKVAR